MNFTSHIFVYIFFNIGVQTFEIYIYLLYFCFKFTCLRMSDSNVLNLRLFAFIAVHHMPILTPVYQ